MFRRIIAIFRGAIIKSFLKYLRVMYKIDKITTVQV
jgi:hypothetical protein